MQNDSFQWKKPQKKIKFQTTISNQKITLMRIKKSLTPNFQSIRI
jgi:hypothetical protein